MLRVVPMDEEAFSLAREAEQALWPIVLQAEDETPSVRLISAEGLLADEVKPRRADPCNFLFLATNDESLKKVRNHSKKIRSEFNHEAVRIYVWFLDQEQRLEKQELESLAWSKKKELPWAHRVWLDSCKDVSGEPRDRSNHVGTIWHLFLLLGNLGERLPEELAQIVETMGQHSAGLINLWSAGFSYGVFLERLLDGRLGVLREAWIKGKFGGEVDGTSLLSPLSFVCPSPPPLDILEESYPAHLKDYLKRRSQIKNFDAKSREVDNALRQDVSSDGVFGAEVRKMRESIYAEVRGERDKSIRERIAEKLAFRLSGSAAGEGRTDVATLEALNGQLETDSQRHEEKIQEQRRILGELSHSPNVEQAAARCSVAEQSLEERLDSSWWWHGGLVLALLVGVVVGLTVYGISSWLYAEIPLEPWMYGLAATAIILNITYLRYRRMVRLDYEHFAAQSRAWIDAVKMRREKRFRAEPARTVIRISKRCQMEVSRWRRRLHNLRLALERNNSRRHTGNFSAEYLTISIVDEKQLANLVDTGSFETEEGETVIIGEQASAKYVLRCFTKVAEEVVAASNTMETAQAVLFDMTKGDVEEIARGTAFDLHKHASGPAWKKRLVALKEVSVADSQRMRRPATNRLLSCDKPIPDNTLRVIPRSFMAPPLKHGDPDVNIKLEPRTPEVALGGWVYLPPTL
jgi:hypothetical protein